MKILITGGTGFIGRNLKERFSKIYETHAPTSSELNLLCEKTVSEYIRKHNFDVVIHTATWNATKTSSKDLSLVLHNNLKMFFNLVRCSDAYGKMIYYGSGTEFDRKHWIPKMSEDYFDTHMPADDYGFSKYIMTKYTADNIYNLRLFGIFGKYEDWEIRFISNACCKALFDLPITIKQNVLFDYIYIEDLLNITQWFIEHDAAHRCYNVCRGEAYELVTLAKMVLAAADKELDIVIAKDGLGTELSGDNSKLLRELRGYEFYSMKESIAQLYVWYSGQAKYIEKEKLLVDK